MSNLRRLSLYCCLFWCNFEICRFADSTWHLGSLGQSCDSVCASVDMSCDIQLLLDTNTASKAEDAAAAVVGRLVNCSDAKEDRVYAHNPGICGSPECCEGTCIGACSYGGKNNTCNAFSPEYERLCPCARLSQPEFVTAPTWHWSGSSNYNEASAGFTWYSHIFDMYQEGHPLQMQMGLGNTGLTPTNIQWGDTCGCNPNGWPDFGEPGCCERNKCSHLYMSFKGGPGFGLGELPTTTPKWRANSATGCHSQQSATPLFGFGDTSSRSCDKLGFVQVSNRLLMAPDGLTFTEVTGMLGSGYVRTPLGKTHVNDTRNYWTLVLDGANFAGPLMYYLPEFFGTRPMGYEEESAHLADFGTAGVGAATGGGGFEWDTIQTWRMSDGSAFKVPKMWFPQKNGRTVLLTNTRGYHDSATFDAIEAVLNKSEDLNPAKLLSNGRPNRCIHAATRHATYMLDRMHAASFGTLNQTIEDDECVWSLHLSDKMNRTTGMIPTYWDAASQPLPQSAVSDELRAKAFPEKLASGTYDAISSPPAGGCASTPGPASPELHCVQTKSPSWIGYKWYKFVDQPALQRSSLDTTERNFLQDRIETLHKMLASNVDNTRWMKRGGSVEAEGLAEIEESLLLTPPAGMEFGYVPIAVYEGLVKPEDCHKPVATTTKTTTSQTIPETNAVQIDVSGVSIASTRWRILTCSAFMLLAIF